MTVSLLSRNLPGSDNSGMLKRDQPASKGAKRMLAIFVALAVSYAGIMTAFFTVLYVLNLSPELRMLSVVGVVVALGGAAGFIVWSVPILFRKDEPASEEITWRALDGDDMGDAVDPEGADAVPGDESGV